MDTQETPDLNLDANEVIERIAALDQNIVQRVIAEMQRDRLIEYFNKNNKSRQDARASLGAVESEVAS